MAAHNLLWEALRCIGLNMQSPWVVIEDFNAVRFSYKISSGVLGHC